MADGRMALLTQDRSGGNQQFLVIGAVGCMTIQTTIPYGCMLVDKRTTLLGMTLVTGLIDSVSLKQRSGDAAMGIMAVDTCNLTLQ